MQERRFRFTRNEWMKPWHAFLMEKGNLQYYNSFIQSFIPFKFLCPTEEDIGVDLGSSKQS